LAPQKQPAGIDVALYFNASLAGQNFLLVPFEIQTF